MGKVKLAVLRKEGVNTCPFGLEITAGCSKAGQAIHRMAPLDILPNLTSEEKQDLVQANNFVYDWQAEGTTCPYAGKILPEQRSVECNWETPEATGAGGALMGSPYYAKMFSGVALNGLYNTPDGVYQNNSLERGFYYGPYSFESVAQKKDR